jgi:sugar phosphate isomerase/epimerase
MKTAVQLYSFRALDEPVTRTIERVGATNLDGVEFAGTSDKPPEQVRRELHEQQLAAAGAHIPVEVIQEDLPAEAENAQMLGVETFVVPILDDAALADAASIEETGSALSSLADSVAEYGFDLCYHNHEFEFGEVDGRPAFERLVEATEGVDFELDVGWAYTAGADPVDLLDRYADRITHVHLKDVAVDSAAERGGRPVDLGAGDVPLRDCASAARAAGVEWAVFEHDDPDDPFDFLAQASEWAAEH